jgi:HSP20 family protein
MWSRSFNKPGFLFGAGFPELKDLIDEVTTACGTVNQYPLLDIWQGENEAIIRAELPGIGPEDLKLEVLRDELTLQGKRQPSFKASEEKQEADKGQYFQRERHEGDFNRTVKLPFEVESESIEASFQNGLLEIRLPKSGAEKARKIDIKVV